MKKKAHPIEIPGYEGRTSELVEFIVGKLRYDMTVEFHAMLAERYLKESERELARGRKKLAGRLKQMSFAEKQTSEIMREVWAICKPFTS